ncbi:MAG: hypothetical protein JRJ59_06800 [Deltaproteobacteria bacterium]|nr:hypothetical protein [Deltaproteobacteria bacterium]
MPRWLWAAGLGLLLAGLLLAPAQAQDSRIFIGGRPQGFGQVSVTVYEHANFRGRQATFYGDVAWLPGGISSFRIHGRGTVTFYRGSGFVGTYETFDRDVANLAHTRIGNDRVSSLRLGQGPAPGGPRPAPGRRGEVVLYRHVNYRGLSQVFTNDVANLAGSRIGNDQVSSLQVHNAVVTLFEHANFRGRRQSFRHDVSDLRRTRFGNDVCSSIKVYLAGRDRLPIAK